jgi:epoxyqueuosine reductase
MGSLETLLKGRARALGFAGVGITAAVAADGFDRLRAWLEHGYAGDMDYLHSRADARRHPDSILPGVRSVVMVAMSYAPVVSGQWSVVSKDEARSASEESSSSLTTDHRPLTTVGRVARYAHGPDYHRVLWDRLNELAAWLEAEQPGCRACGVADTAPLLERDFARRAGLGWIAKNTMLIDRRLGSYTVLGGLLTDLELQPDAPFTASHCGTCTACLDACPTQAFPAAGVLDARRCISYLTIELRGPVPEELRPGLGDWVFGCDVCQEVCPWNRKAAPGHAALAPRADLMALDPAELLGLNEEEFRRRFRGTALWRAKRRGLLRNAALVLGNVGGAEALPALRRALEDAEPLVRDAAAWAVQRIAERLALGEE